MAHIKTVDGVTVLVDEWHIEDVHQAAGDMGITVTDEEAEDVLCAVARSFDANIGINWELFYYHLEDYRND
jgi:hypothetical protein